MYRFRNHFKHSSLFIILFMVTVISIISVAVIVTWTTIRMSEQFFIEKFSITNAKVLNQVKESFESFNYSVILASNNLSQSGSLNTILSKEHSNSELMNSYFNLKQLMKRAESNLDAYDVSIIVNGENGISYSANRNYWPISDKDLSNGPIAKKVKKEPNYLKYHFDQQTNSYREKVNYIIATRALMERQTKDIYGISFVAIREKEFRKFYSSFINTGSNIYVIDKSGRIVSSNHEEQIGQVDFDLLLNAVDLEKNENNYVIKDYYGKEHIFFGQYLESFDMYVVNVIDKGTAVQGLIDKKQFGLIFLGIILTALLIVFIIARKLTNSLSTLVKEISNASKHNFHHKVSVSGTYETRRIAWAFNSMLDELHDYVEQLVNSQKEKRHAELAALQQQINPHFLYNTLTSIKFMVQYGSKEDAEDTMNAFISLLQNTIGNGSETSTVNQEVDNLKDYVLINQKRYGNRIKVSYFIAPGCGDYRVPKLILQPFLENAFFHGFNHKSEGFIKVVIWNEGETLICEVIDNGDGMELEESKKLPGTNRKLERFTGIGIRNVHERIQLYYGSSYGVHITSQLGEGTRIRITMPAKKED